MSLVPMDFEENNSYNTLYGNTKYKKDGTTVFLNISYNGSTNSDGYLLNGSSQILVMPEGYRPPEPIYFFATGSGNSASAPYLCRLESSGKILVYKRSDTISYLFGNVCFMVAS